MAQKQRINTLAGRTVRWTFTDGPTAGTTYEHAFGADGSIGFRAADKSGKGKFTMARDGAVVKIDDATFAVSYLAESGFTLTVVLNTQRMEMVGFASNNESWFQQKGTFEVIA
jgi:hypothetical protein